MKIIGLISGGKDSIFNLIQCKNQGHNIICLGHISRPKDKGELDSYMYQTVGSEMIAAIADCMNLPLIMKEITGKSINQNLEYNQTDNDEVEDLYILLKEALNKYPDLKGVSSGAIKSTYQKNRVENICSRLGLVSLSYLWERDQSELLNEMISHGMRSVIIKSCAYGMGEVDLLKTIQELQPKFEKLKKETQLNVCGEGGEYETLTLDCELYKKYIKIKEHEVVVHSEDVFTKVCYVIIKDYELISK